MLLGYFDIYFQPDSLVLFCYIILENEICDVISYFLGNKISAILLFIYYWLPGSKSGTDRSSFAFLTFLRIPVSLVGSISLLRYSVSSPPFPHKKSSGDHANHFQGSLYFSFLPVKQRDFPGNVRSGGCDSLPLVVAFTSKQHESPLSYALHFLHIISHQMCCVGERAVRRAPVCGETSPPPWEKCKKSKSFHRGGYRAVKGSIKSVFCFISLPPNWTKKRRKTKSPGEPTLHLSLEREHISLWYGVYFRRGPGPTLTCSDWSAALNLTRCLTLTT